jgi:hypothetical protein
MSDTLLDTTPGAITLPGGRVVSDSPRLLPALDRTANPSPNTGGSWTAHGGGLSTLAKYAKAIDVPDSKTAPERFKSIPSPWARLLLFEQALFSKDHPAHKQILGEWRGILGCLAFNGYLPLGVTINEVQLDQGDDVIASLRRMAPDEGDGRWNRLALIYVGGRLIGGTSAHTLVFTGIRPVESAIPFQHQDRLIDPGAYYEAQDDRDTLTLLAQWQESTLAELRSTEGRNALSRFLGKQPSAQGVGAVSRADKIIELLDGWYEETRARLTRMGGARPLNWEMTSSAFANRIAEGDLAEPVLKRLRSIKPRDGEELSQRNDLRMLEGSLTLLPGSTGRILREDGAEYNGILVVGRGFSCAVADGRITVPLTGEHVGSSSVMNLAEFFEPRLIRVAEVNERYAIALRGGGGRYLLPIRKEILKHLSAEQLARYVAMEGDEERGFTVRLRIPLQRELAVEWKGQYHTADVEKTYTSPSIAIWPDFRSPLWSHHFFFVRPEALERNLDLRPVDELTSEYTDTGGDRWGETEQPITAWEGVAGRERGLLLCHPLPHQGSREAAWEVSIDFGSTHTRVYRSARDVGGSTAAEPVELRSRATPLLGNSATLPSFFFVADDNEVSSSTELQSLVKLPLGVRPTRAAQQWLPVDGVIYRQLLHGNSSVDGLRANLKWHEDDADDRPAFHSYISQLFLSVAAEAAAAGARIDSIITAYPSVFPLHLKNHHQEEWESLKDAYGIHVKEALPEAAAVAAFLVANRGGETTNNLLAIDIGGSTSDLALWADNTVQSLDSVRLSGSILSRVVSTSKDSQEAVRRAMQRLMPEVGFNWIPGQGDVNGLIFSALLRTVTRQHGSTVKLARRINEGPGSEGERFIAYAGYLYATVSYLAGLMVRRARLDHQHYRLFFAGRGSEFLQWLDTVNEGAAIELPRSFFLAGAEAVEKQPSVSIDLPGEYAKQEVGRGLLERPVGNVSATRTRKTFVGETGLLFRDGQAVDWDGELTFESLKEYQKPGSESHADELLLLRGFVNAFQETESGRIIARALQITPSSLTSDLRNRIVDKLFGVHSAWRKVQSHNNPEHSLLEPFFVVEAKVLLEYATRNFHLFRDA